MEDGSSLQWGAAHPGGVVLPIRLRGPCCQGCVDETQNLPELAVIHTHDEKTTSVTASGFGPFPHDPGKITDVESHHDPVLVCCEFEKTVVFPPVQLSLLVGRPHIVAAFPQCDGYHPPRDVGIQEEPHAVLSVDGVDRRELTTELIQRSVGVADRIVDV